MNVGVCYAQADRQLWIKLEVPDGSTIATAIELSGLLTQYPEIDLESQKVGIFGKISKLDTLVKEGGVAPADITCYDAIRDVPATIFDRATKEFPGVHFADSTGTDGREKAVPDMTKPLVL